MATPDETTIVKVTNETHCSTAEEDTVYSFFIDDVLLYHCFTPELAHEYLEDITKHYETEYKRLNPTCRVFVEKQNDWKYVIQRSRDGMIMRGKPKQTHVVEIRRSQKLLKLVKLGL